MLNAGIFSCIHIKILMATSHEAGSVSCSLDFSSSSCREPVQNLKINQNCSYSPDHYASSDVSISFYLIQLPASLPNLSPFHHRLCNLITKQLLPIQQAASLNRVRQWAHILFCAILGFWAI